LATPRAGAVESVNKLYDEGNTIIIYSARTWMEYEMTVDWLKKNNVKYHQLMMGKPIGDVWIDDRALQFGDWESMMNQLAAKAKKK
jgi:hypothetical protein